MHWNHRVVDFSDENDGEPWVEVCEVFYDKNQEHYLYTARGVGVMGENKEEVKETLYKMLDCLNKPVLMKADFNQNIKVWIDADTD
jgi:hypothetical protein